MKNFIDWLTNNWAVVSAIVIGVANLLVVILKKTKVVDSALAAVLEKLPDFIVEAESTGNIGSAKYTYAFCKAINYLMLIKGDSQNVVVAKYSNILDSAIENILSCPQKKEVIEDEKEIIQKSK